MANIYVGQMKDYLKSYYQKQKDFNAKIADNNKRFSPEYAEKENKKVREQQGQAYNEAQANIIKVFEEAKGLLAKSNFLNVESLTADRLFFEDNSAFMLTADEVKSYLEKYSGNPTMTRLIADWLKKHDKPTDEHTISPYAGIKVVMPIDKVMGYKKFGEGALSIIDKIYNNHVIMDNPIELDYFANEDFARSLFDTVGTGMELSDYKSKRVPDTASACFDNIKLSGSDPNYYM